MEVKNMKIDARGMQCPLPVIEAKKAIEKIPKEEVIEITVDNEIAVQNLTKLAVQKHIHHSVMTLDEKQFIVVFTLNTDNETSSKNVEDDNISSENIQKGTVLVLSSNKMGDGDEELGKQLMKGFIYAQTQLEQLPESIVLYNGGAKLSVEGSDSLEDLKHLEKKGVEIVTCGLCLNYYNLTDKLQVGTITNMYAISEKLAMANKIIKP